MNVGLSQILIVAAMAGAFVLYVWILAGAIKYHTAKGVPETLGQALLIWPYMAVLGLGLMVARLVGVRIDPSGRWV